MNKTLTIVLPVYNEEAILEKNALEVLYFTDRYFKNLDWKIILVDNGSTDRTPEICDKLSREHPQVQHLVILEKGKGGAIQSAWKKYCADVNVFMDADLATDLVSLPQLVETVLFKRADIAVGSRYEKDARTERTWERKAYSYILRRLLQFYLGLSAKDAPCGFKAVNRRVVEEVVPFVENKSWFFDTELLFCAQKMGFQIFEIPVQWKEKDTDIRKSRVGAWKVGWEYAREMRRVRAKISNI